MGRHFPGVFEPIRDWFLLVAVDEKRRGKASRS
jgi:hypothetical protein